jgi:serine/threonine-protein kinase
MAMEDLVGRRLGKYELRSQIGRGGMGVVYEGYDPMLERRVAVKVLAPHLVWEQKFVERFLREARAAARLDHPNIVTIHDVGQDAGWYYFVMQYLEGRPLTALIREHGPLDTRAVLRILRPLAGALDYAHERGLVHRDVKPANVIVGANGHPTLTDFGIAHAARTTRLTQSGVVVGTPEYMSPEQAQGKRVDACSDQYSLAVIAYELLSGHPPFEAESTPALLYKVVHERVPPLRAARPDLPVEAAQALELALAKEPGLRFPSCASFVERLAAALQPLPMPGRREPPTTPTRPPRRRVPRWVWGIAGLLAAALVIWMATALGGGPEVLPAPDDVRTPVFMVTLEPTPTETAEPTLTPTPIPAPTLTPVPPLPPAGTVPGDTWVHPLTNVTMVYVPAGELEMGSSEGEPGEHPVHTVFLDAFWIDLTEVTVDQFRQFVDATGHETTAEREGSGYVWDASAGRGLVEGADWEHPHGPESGAVADHPVMQVSWDDAVAYCEWAGGQLPTEAQWEYAARGDGEPVYPWGDGFDCSRGNFDDETEIDAYTVPGDAGCDGYVRTAPVGSFPAGASWCGALDLSGNVWEWVADWYGEYPSGRQRNPTGPASGEHRVIRGGSWDDSDRDVRAARRFDTALPIMRVNVLGFRCVVLLGG